MVRNNENVQSQGNSLLRTATSKLAGPGRFAGLVARGTAKPPISKVKVPSSDESRVSELTASIVEAPQPVVVKEVRADDIDAESSIFAMSATSAESFSFVRAFGNHEATTPQPTQSRAYKQPPPRRDGKPMPKKSMEIQPGLSLKAPSPMSLDRIQVQMGQERNAPESAEYRQEREERRKLEEKKRAKNEYNQAKKAAVEQLKEVVNNEIGEGFETQLEDDDEVLEAPAKKKSLVKKMWGKLRPKKPMTSERAHAIARQALERSKGQRDVVDGRPPLVPLVRAPLAPFAPRQWPFQDVAANGEEVFSDLDNSQQRKGFPVREVQLKSDGDARDDTSVSTLGTAHVLERTGQGVLNLARYGKDVRDPTPTGLKVGMREKGVLFDDLDEKGMLFSDESDQEMFLGQEALRKSAVDGLRALIDQIDSGTGTEDAGAGTNHSLDDCFPGTGKSNGDGLLKNCGLALASLWGNALGGSQPSSNSGKNREKFSSSDNKPSLAGQKKHREGNKLAGIARGDDSTWDDSSFSGIDLKKTLSPIEEDEPRRNADGIIDLTNLASPAASETPMSPTTDGGVKGEKGARPQSLGFDDFMDIAASKLERKKGTDRYTIEEGGTPRYVIRGHDLQNDSVDDDNIPVVKGTKIKKSENETTPRAKGARKPKPSTQGGPLSPQSSFEVYEHPEGDIVMWSENPLNKRKSPGSKNRFPGHFSDGLFDLLSMDESVSRGRKKVPFLAEQLEIGTADEDDELVPEDAQFFDFICENENVIRKQSRRENSMAKRSRKNARQSEAKFERESTDDEDIRHDTIDPSVGVMCGAVPLYFMYTMQNKKQDVSNDGTKKNKYIEREDDASQSGTALLEDEHKGNLPNASPKKNERNEGHGESMEIPLLRNFHPDTDSSRDKVLLDGDDAYWDTLSTIASTKDRSSESAKVTNLVVSSEPHPIPVEITMNNNKTHKTDDSEDNSAAAEVKNAKGRLTSMIEEESSTDTEGEGVNTKARGANVIDLLTSMIGEENSTDTAAEVENVVEKMTRMIEDEYSTDSEQPKDPEGTTKNARGQSDYQSRKGGEGSVDAPQNQSKQPRRGVDVEESKISQQANFHGQRPLPETGRAKHVSLKSNLKPDPEQVFSGRSPLFHGLLNGNAFVNPWKHSNRSVSWGVEEIYEPKEDALSPNSTSEKNHRFAESAAATSASTAQQQQQQQDNPSSPVSNGSHSRSGDTRLSDEEEQELICRTLELSRQLLASMTSQDLEGADTDIVKSLLSFGTNETSAKVSLPTNARMNEEGMTFADNTTNVPETVHVDKNNIATGQRRSPVPTVVRSLGAASPNEGRSQSFTDALFNFIKPSDGPASRHDDKETSPGVAFSESQPSSAALDDSADSAPSSQVAAPSIQQVHTGRSEDSPIDIEAMFNKYDVLANHLLKENAELKYTAQQQQHPAIGSDRADKRIGTATTASSSSPKTRTRLEQLRAQRAEAEAKIQSRQFGNRVQVGNPKDRLTRYVARPISTGRAYQHTHNADSSTSPTVPTLMADRRPRSAERGYQSSDYHHRQQDRLETVSTSSDSCRTTPSMKARELRKQLDDALQASRNIRDAQAKLGNELDAFKNRFYQKHDELEEQAFRALRGL